MKILSYSHITSRRCVVNGRELAIPPHDGPFLTAVYRALEPDYPKFFKMDNLCKLGFLCSEMLLRASHLERTQPRHDVSVVCFNSSSSLDDDLLYQRTIQQADAYFPSPSVFVYTLANIVTGEIAIRNKFLGQSAFYVFERFSPERMCELIDGAFFDDEINYLICGWVETLGNTLDAFMVLVSRDDTQGQPISIEIINKLYNS